MHYFDHNASTPMDRRVVDAMLPYFNERYGNPSSLHRLGRVARSAMDTARQQVAGLVNARPDQVIFTSGGTEANNLALQGSMFCSSGTRMALSTIEHASIMAQRPVLENRGLRVDWVAVDEQGCVSPDALETCLKKQPALVSIMMANNETGVLQNGFDVGAVVREYGALYHTDATQMAGKAVIDFGQSQAHMMTLSAHKLRGPKGVGALIVDDAVSLTPMIAGGGHESGFRAGTENVAGIVGFGAAAELAMDVAPSAQAMLSYRDQFEAQLKAALPGVTVFSEKAPRLPNTSCFSLPRWHGETVLMQLDKAGFGVSSGSACHSGVDTPSHVLKAMNISDEAALGAVRVSLGCGQEWSEIEALLKAIIAIGQETMPYPCTAW